MWLRYPDTESGELLPVRESSLLVNRQWTEGIVWCDSISLGVRGRREKSPQFRTAGVTI